MTLNIQQTYQRFARLTSSAAVQIGLLTLPEWPSSTVTEGPSPFALGFDVRMVLAVVNGKGRSHESEEKSLEESFHCYVQVDVQGKGEEMVDCCCR